MTRIAWNKGKSMPEETRLKISQAKKGISSPRKGKTGKPLSKEHKAKISKSLLGNTRTLGRKHSEETKARMSAMRLGNTYAKGNKGKPHSLEHNEKVSRAHLGKPGHIPGKETRYKQALAAARNIKAGKIGYKHKPHPYTTKDGRLIVLRNSWEYKAAVYIDTMLTNYTWIYEQAPLEYDGKVYIPDFFLYDIDGELRKIIEVKGRFIGENQEKFYIFKDYLESCGVVVELWNKLKLKELGII